MLAKSAFRFRLIALALALFISCGPAEHRSEAPPKPAQAPSVFKVKFHTNEGDFVVEVTRNWAPRAADRFYELVNAKFYDGCRFFRVVRNFVAQFGINGDPAVSRQWSRMIIPDDPPKESNQKGTLSFAMSGPATRTTQVFINLADNTPLDSLGFVPFGRVLEGMEVVEKLDRSYGDFPPRGNAPDQGRMEREGNEYIERYFPRLDYILTATVVP